MTETLERARRTAAVTIRAYRPTDHRDCRRLWAELAREHRELYDDPDAATSEDDLGAGFEEYLTRLDLSGMWVAEDPTDGVVGFVGLLLAGAAGEVEPVVVTTSRRGQGIGRALLAYVADQARRRGLKQLTISPASRNIDAIRCLHAAGYDALARVTLAIDLSDGGPDWRDGLDVHDLRFRY
jgi:GNAT superfamily N-acetyltransferase